MLGMHGERRRVGVVGIVGGALIAGLLTFVAPTAASAASVTESEPNGNRSTADVVAVGATVSGATLSQYSTDSDYYAVDLPSDGRISLGLTFPSSLGAGDVYYVEVLDASGSTLYDFDVTGNRSDGSWLKSWATYAPAGRTYIRVYGENGWASWGKSYSLTVGFTAGLVETEFNASRSTADVVAVGATVSGATLSQYSTDPDYYAVDLAAASTVSLGFTFPAGLSGSTYDLDVYNSKGTSLAHFDLTSLHQDGKWLASQTLTLPAGRNYIRVSGDSSWTSWGKKYQLTVSYAFTKVSKPKVSGTAKVGKKLTAVTGSWSPKPGFAYQWLRNGKAISGATSSTYTLKSADAGKKISVKIVAKKSGYASVTKTSAAVSVPLQAFSKVSKPKVSGTAKAGKKLTAVTGSWSPTPGFKYQWLRNGKSIKGATKSTYTLTSADAGKKISVKIVAKKSGYASVTKTSAAVSVR
ncbi:MAG: hypothetical protein QM622_06470 [Microbacterium sp.]